MSWRVEAVLLTSAVMVAGATWPDRDPRTVEVGPLDTTPLDTTTTTTTVAVSNDGYLPAPTPGDCDSYRQRFVDAGLPATEFLHVAQVESGCDHRYRHTDADDHGGGLLGFNVRPDLAPYWLKLCGLTYDNLTVSVDRQIDCAAKAYGELGSEPWENSWP